MSIDAEPGLGLSMVRIEAEYSKTGSAIVRLTPKYEPMPLWALLSERALGPLGEATGNLIYSQIKEVPGIDKGPSISANPKRQYEETLPDDIWDKLPNWMKVLHNLKQNARQDH